MKRFLPLIFIGLVLCFGTGLRANELPKITRTEDVIYGRKFGLALTLDVLEPERKNGAAIFWVLSSGYASSHDNIKPVIFTPLLERGYTIVAVVHGPQPRFIVPEIIDDIHRAIRFVRHNASRWGVDPNMFGISGGSAGAHFALLIGTQSRSGDANAKDAIDRESSAVQAVACIFPPTDFLNVSRPNEDWMDFEAARQFETALGSKGMSREERQALGRTISPVNYVTAALPPTLVIHGDEDKIIPLYQAQMFEGKCREVGARFKLIIRQGAGHAYAGWQKEFPLLADWFDETLLALKTPTPI